jgi:cation:H+ antiporter
MVVAGLVVAMAASRGAVGHASALAFGTRIPPFVIGITLVALGTDLPEIANSIIASASGHGDLNVGDSVGSAATQVTLIIGLLPFLTRSITLSRRSVGSAGGLTVAALVVVAFLVNDGFLGRGDGLILIGLWIVTSVAVWRLAGSSEPEMAVPARSKGGHAAMVLVMLGIVGVAAGAAVWAFVELADLLGVPEYIIAFFATSIGTSVPELVVIVTALRRGERDIALGDGFGASLVDSTLSIGVGPALFPVAVTADLATQGALLALVAVGAVTVLLAGRRRHDRISGGVALALYAGLYTLLLL